MVHFVPVLNATQSLSEPGSETGSVPLWLSCDPFRPPLFPGETLFMLRVLARSADCHVQKHIEAQLCCTWAYKTLLRASLLGQVLFSCCLGPGPYLTLFWSSEVGQMQNASEMFCRDVLPLS